MTNLTWNHRLVMVNGEVGIYEVYYEDGKPVSRTEDECSPKGDEEFVRKILIELSKSPLLDDSDICFYVPH